MNIINDGTLRMCGMSFTDFRFSWKDERKTKGRLAADERKRTKAVATVLARCGCRRGRVEDDEGCGDRVRGSGLWRLAMKIGGNSTDEGRARQSSAKSGARAAE
ncbi:hypothetical protein ACOSQ2_007886 [Xanthoceras sorbifolium]